MQQEIVTVDVMIHTLCVCEGRCPSRPRSDSELLHAKARRHVGTKCLGTGLLLGQQGTRFLLPHKRCSRVYVGCFVEVDTALALLTVALFARLSASTMSNKNGFCSICCLSDSSFCWNSPRATWNTGPKWSKNGRIVSQHSTKSCSRDTLSAVA